MQKRSQSLTLRRMKGTTGAPAPASDGVGNAGRVMIRAGLLGTLAVSLSACGDEPMTEVTAFRSVDQCLESGLFDQEACQTMMQDALATHEEQAPRYAEEELCEQEFGLNACEVQREDGQSFWMPFFTGWVVGNVAGEVIDEVGDAFKKKRKYKYGYAQPFYRTTSRDVPFRTLSGGTLNVSRDGTVRTQARALVSTPKAAPKVMTRTTVASRGGFAGSSRFGGGSRFGG